MSKNSELVSAAWQYYNIIVIVLYMYYIYNKLSIVIL